MTDSPIEKNNQLSHSALQNIYNSAPIGILVIKENRILYLNPHLLELLRYQSSDELIDMHVSDFLPIKSYEKLERWNEMRREKKSVTGELDLFCFDKNKSLIPIHIDIARIELTEGFGTLVFIQDITKRKSIENELEITLNRYQNLIDSAPIGILVSKDNKIILANPYICNLFGFNSQEEILGMETLILVPQESHREILEKRKMRSEGLPVPKTYDFVGLKQDGKQFPIHITVDDIELPEGSGRLTFIEDISERKRVDIELMESEARYRTLVENAPEAIVVYDVDKDLFVDANQNACDLFQRTREELLNMGPLPLYKPFTPDGTPTSQMVFDRISRALAGETIVTEILVLDRNDPDGKEIPCELRVVQLPASNKRLIRGSFVNIAYRKKTEEQLIESEAKYRTMVENSPEAILLVDFESGKYIDANEKAERLFKMNKSELLSKGPVEVSPECQENGRKSIEYVVDVLSQALAGMRPVYEWLHIDSEGNTIPCEVRLVKLPSSEQTLVRASIIDISERKKAEFELQNAREMLLKSQKMEALGQLAGGIAHDFNNALTIIKGYSSFLLKDIPEVVPSYNYARKILEATDNASILTKQLLSISRRRMLKPSIANLNLVVDRINVMLKRVIPGNIKVITDLDENLRNVKIDTVQIEQVIINLVINARDAMPNGGNLQISTRNNVDHQYFTKFSTDERIVQKMIMLSISDSGTGIEEEIIDRIFEPFFTTKETGKGTGLGLSAAYGIISQSGCHIDVESEVGVGTTFRIFFPCEEGPSITEEMIPVTPSEDLSDKKMTILVVDDDDHIRALVSEILKRSGYGVLEANHANKAIEICEKTKRRIDLVLTDIVMPDMNGYELIHQIININPDMKVLFMTGYSGDVSIISRVQESGYKTIEKPFDDEYLVSVIENLLN